MGATNTRTSATDRELVFVRVFDAPREMVFEAWADPKHLEQWWGPFDYVTRISEMDVRPGGMCRLAMRAPDGIDYCCRIVFLEVARPERMVYRHYPEKGAEPINFQVTVILSEEAGRTSMRMEMLFPSAGARNFVVQKYHTDHGAEQTLSRLAEYLSKMTSVAGQPTDDMVTTRTFAVTREMAFRAWIEPERLCRWWGPSGFTNPVCEFEPWPDGLIRIHMQAPDGTIYPISGSVREIAAPERLVFTSAALDADGHPLLEVLNTVLFEEKSGKTRITLRTRVTSTTPGGARQLAGMREGWGQSLDRLAAELSAPGKPAI